MAYTANRVGVPLSRFGCTGMEHALEAAAPALVVELKWNHKRGEALGQIRDRDYARVLRGWGGPVLLVGVTYDPKTKVHTCQIEEAWPVRLRK